MTVTAKDLAEIRVQILAMKIANETAHNAQHAAYKAKEQAEKDYTIAYSTRQKSDFALEAIKNKAMAMAGTYLTEQLPEDDVQATMGGL